MSRGIPGVETVAQYSVTRVALSQVKNKVVVQWRNVLVIAVSSHIWSSMGSTGCRTAGESVAHNVNDAIQELFELTLFVN